MRMGSHSCDWNRAVTESSCESGERFRTIFRARSAVADCRYSCARILRPSSQSVFGNWLGSTGHWPVPTGDSPDGTGRASPANAGGLLVGAAAAVPVGGPPPRRSGYGRAGGSPTGAGQWPAPHIFQTRSKPPGTLSLRTLKAHDLPDLIEQPRLGIGDESGRCGS